MEKSKGKVAGFFGGIGRFFRGFGEAVAKGDLFVKLSLIWMGAGYFRRKQYVKSILDNSFMILLFSVVSIVIWVVFLLIWISNVKHAYELQKMSERGEHMNTFLEDLNTYRNENFYKTLLALPVAGVVVFTAIPLLILILVAFTNYDLYSHTAADPDTCSVYELRPAAYAAGRTLYMGRP